MLETVKTCDLCGGSDFKPAFSGKNFEFNEEFTILECKSCRLLFVSPRPDPSVIGKYYQSGNYYAYQDTSQLRGLKNFLEDFKNWLYRIHYQKDKNVFEGLICLFGRIILSFFPTLPPKAKLGSLLDVGCGSGSFMARLKQAGWNVTGVEIDPAAVVIAERNGLEVYRGELTALEFEWKRFDVILFSQVLEHVYSPAAYLNRAKQLLAQDGILLIGIPNPECWLAKCFGIYWHAWDLPRHLYHFKKNALLEYMEKTNLKLVSIKRRHILLSLRLILKDLNLKAQDKRGTFSLFIPIYVVAFFLYILNLALYLCPGVDKNITSHYLTYLVRQRSALD